MLIMTCHPCLFTWSYILSQFIFISCSCLSPPPVSYVLFPCGSVKWLWQCDLDSFFPLSSVDLCSFLKRDRSSSRSLLLSTQRPNPVISIVSTDLTISVGPSVICWLSPHHSSHHKHTDCQWPLSSCFTTISCNFLWLNIQKQKVISIFSLGLRKFEKPCLWI